MARFAAAATPSRMSASISRGSCARAHRRPCVSGWTAPRCPPVRSRHGCPPPDAGRDVTQPRRQRTEPTGDRGRAVSGGYFGKPRGGAGQSERTARARPPAAAPLKSRGPAGNGASSRALMHALVVGGHRLPAKGAISHHAPGECCDRVKRRVTRAKARLPPVTDAGADPGWALDPRLEGGRRPASRAALGAARPPALRPWFARGRGEPEEDRRYQHLVLAASFSEMGSVARRTLGALCEEDVNRILTDMKQAAMISLLSVRSFR